MRVPEVSKPHKMMLVLDEIPCCDTCINIDGNPVAWEQTWHGELEAKLLAAAQAIENLGLAAAKVRDQVKELLAAHHETHRIYGSTATCRGGIGGAAMTAHCSQVCHNPVHEAENQRWENAYRAIRLELDI